MNENHTADVLVAGAGPGGSICAQHLARSGLKVVLVDRMVFPRRKGCGDCLNPHSWDVFDRAGVVSAVRALPRVDLFEVEFRTPAGRRTRVSLPDNERCETAIERRLLDSVLINAARDAGAEVIEGVAVTGVERVARGWRVRAEGRSWSVPAVVGADGRNSTIARMTGRLPRARKGRVAIQTHLPLPARCKPRLHLWLFWEGYAGFAPVSRDMLSLYLVSTAAKLPSLQRRVLTGLDIQTAAHWNTVAPLSRPDAVAATDGLFLVGDAARVVEPFTGEGSYYAMRTGELAASNIAAWLKSGMNQVAAENAYIAQHHAAYRGRLWINQLARGAVTIPLAGASLIRLGAIFPSLLRILTRRLTVPRP